MDKVRKAEKIGAPCPTCGTRWFWDFCSDVYKDIDGVDCVSEVDIADDGFETVRFYCLCGEYLSTNDEDGGHECIEAFKNINWDSDEYSSYPC